MAKKKVLLMGKAHSGKTSMRSIIFANYLARDTMRLSPTLDVEHHHVRFLGDLHLNLWDCGGQDAFYESYFERDRETIFRSVELLIYVFDIESDCPEKDFDHFAGVLEALEENSPEARIFVLVHKMDLVAEDERDLILDDRKRLIEECCAGCGVHQNHASPHSLRVFGTSIWDETLYKAWSEIVTNLIPNIGVLEHHLDDFCRICDADEVVLFERATFLVISHAQAGKGGAGDGGGAAAPPLLQDATDGDASSADAEEGEAIAADTSAPDGDDEKDQGGVGGGEADEPASSAEQTLAASATLPDAVVGSPSAPAGDLPGSDGVGGKLPPPQLEGGDGGGSAAGGEGSGPSSPASAVAEGRLLPQRPGPSGGGPADPDRFDAHRFEKISNIIKQFKLSCGKAQSQFQGMEVRNSRFSAFIDIFTANTYIMVIVSRPDVHPVATQLNIRNSREHFERFIPRSWM